MKQPLHEEFRRMQKLAGIITENLNEDKETEIEAQIKTHYPNIIKDGDAILMQGAGNIGQLAQNLIQKKIG